MAEFTKYDFPKSIYGTTPTGVASYTFVNKPSTKFNADGVYSTKVILEATDAAEFTAKAEALRDAALAMIIPQIKNKKPKLADLPWKMETNDQGDETGRIVLSFKMKATTKKGHQKPLLVDAKKVPTTVNVWSGSKIKVAYRLDPFYTSALGLGVSSKLLGVQIIDLVTGQGGGAAGMFGEEEGFEADDETPVVITEDSVVTPAATAADASAF